MKRTNYAKMVEKHKFSANSSAATALKNGEDDKTLAIAVKKTKPYKEDAELKKATDEIIKGEPEKPKPENESKTKTNKGGEPRGY